MSAKSTSSDLNGIRFAAVPNVSDLESHRPAWEELARAAPEDNPFYEPWMLIPALQSLGESDGVETVFAYRGEKLLGVFPLQKLAKYRGLPLSHVQLWQHRHCYLCTPLIRRGEEAETLRALFAWLRSSGQGPLLAWNWASEDGAIYRELERLAGALGWTVRKTGYERAVLRGRTDGEEYLKAAISGKHRRDFGRLEKRLSECGEYAYGEIKTGPEARQWLESFFDLEAGGWKGREGTAMKNCPGDREFMTRIVLSAFEAKRAILSLSTLDGKPIACKVDFLSGKSSFSFKVAFNEEFGKFRPGLLMELFRLRMLSSTGCDFFDSCSMPGSIFDRLWTDRRKIANVSVATRAFPEGVVVRAYPVAKAWALKLLSLRRSPGSPRGRSLSQQPPEAETQADSAPA